jgi:hypothetical protein
MPSWGGQGKYIFRHVRKIEKEIISFIMSVPCHEATLLLLKRLS